jgi:micrococcal nuclease
MNLFETIVTVVSLLYAWFAPVIPPVAVSAVTTAEVVSVIDGDTIIVTIDGQKETVRYIGIDTPEPRREGTPECGSHEATEFNRALVEGKPVRLVADEEDRDQYDRLLRYVYVGEGETEEFVNAALLQAGLAKTLTIPPNDTHSKQFSTLAAGAAAVGLGNWSRCE